MMNDVEKEILIKERVANYCAQVGTCSNILRGLF